MRRLGAGQNAGPKPAPRGKQTPAASLPPSSITTKNISAQNKQDFRSAREKLLLAQEMSPADPAKNLLDRVNQVLAFFCMGEARKAMQRNDSGTAYVYMMSAQNYTPESSAVVELLDLARTQFEEKTRVSIGVIFENKAGVRDSEAMIRDVASEIESIATRVGLAQPLILKRTQSANAWRAIQGGTSPASPIAIFSGDLLSANSEESGARPVGDLILDSEMGNA